MRILIAFENVADRQNARKALHELPFLKWDDTMHLTISDECPSKGSMALVLSRHPKGSFYDLIIAGNRVRAGMPLFIMDMLREKDIEPPVPFIVVCRPGEGLPGMAEQPGNTFPVKEPLTAESLRSTLERIVVSLTEREDRQRKGEMESLMAKLAAGDKITNFPSLMENLYIQSATRIMHCRKYAPWHAAPHQSLANVYMGCNRYETAIVHAKKGLEIDPGSAALHRLLATAYRKAGKSFEELEELRGLLRDNPDSSELLLKVGEAYLREQDFLTAEQYFLHAIQSYNPAEEARLLAKLHVGLGRAYASEGERAKDDTPFKKAEKEFKEAIHIYPLLLSAYNNLIIVYKRLGQYGEAMKMLALATEITPDTAEDWISLFEIFLIDGDAEKARFSLQKALKFDPENQITLCTAAEIYVRQGMFANAVSLFEKAAEVNPSDPRLYNFLGVCSRQLSRFDLAIGYYLNALKLDPGDEGLHFNLSVAYAHNGRPEMARRELEEALRIKPEFPEAREALENLLAERSSPAQSAPPDRP